MIRLSHYAAGVLAVVTFAVGGSLAQADERLKDIACRSVHLGYPAPTGTAFYNEVTIDQSAPGTYFMACGWDKGYFGLQELGNGKKLLIFSVWDSNQNDPKAVREDRRTKLLAKDDKVRIGRFGGEGTGGQSFFDYDWKLGETYRLLVTAKVNGERTEYTGYFFVPENQEWKRLVAFSTVTGGKLMSGYYSFVEDFKRDRVSATKPRRAHFGNGWVTTASGESIFLSKARFTADSNPVLNINADVDGERFFLVTGGDTANTGAKLREIMSLPPQEGRKPPDGLPRADAAAQSPSVDLLRGPWEGGVVERESLLFLRRSEGKASAKLLYDVEKIIAVQRADGRRTFEVDRDFVVAPDGSGLILTGDSRITALDESELFRPKGSEHSIGHRAGSPETSVLFDNAHYFHDRQVEVTYVPRRPEWGAKRPRFAGERLPRTLEKLRVKQPVTIAVSGDSISEGYNASEFTKTEPFQPPYPTLVASQLEAKYGSKVVLHNLAVGGWSSGQGLSHIDDVLKRKPDLVILAYGMNDVGARNPEAFRETMATMVRRVREADPATEIVLVATMTGNPDWVATPPEMFPKYRDALASLEGPGVVLADLTAVWQRLLVRKHHVDLTGNGVNHPNDFGHRVYAQAILALLVDRASKP